MTPDEIRYYYYSREGRSLPAPEPAQKYHHGPCNEHCRCGRTECAEIHRKLRAELIEANRNGPNELGVYVTGKCVRCGERFAPDGGSIQPEPSEPTKHARRFCACGQELMGARLEFGYLSPVCGDCAAHKGPGAPSLDTRIAAARAVTDEAEGAWSTATSEGP